MCNNNNSHRTVPDLDATSMISKESTIVVALKPARKTRTKTRKPKFLSLRLELSSDNSLDSGEVMARNHHPQLDLFPLHPENMVEDKDMHDENMAYIFAASDGGATLNGLLGGEAASAEVPSEDSLSPSLTYAYGGRESEDGASTLVRTALRNRERDACEEKWVCYSEVVEKKEEEVTSSAADLWCKSHSQGLSLKLDYQEILNAWSGKGPLFIEGESPQTVPDLVHDTANVSPSAPPSSSSSIFLSYFQTHFNFLGIHFVGFWIIHRISKLPIWKHQSGAVHGVTVAIECCVGGHWNLSAPITFLLCPVGAHARWPLVRVQYFAPKMQKLLTGNSFIPSTDLYCDID